MNNNINHFPVDQRLYNVVDYAPRVPADKEDAHNKMVKVIGSDPSVEDFIAAWKENSSCELGFGDKYNQTVFQYSIIFNNVKLTEFFIQQLGVDYLNKSCNAGWTPLGEAYMQHSLGEEISLKMLDTLLKAGADAEIGFNDDVVPNAHGPGFHESLFRAVLPSNLDSLKSLDVTRLFMEYGAGKLMAYAPDRKSLIQEEFPAQKNEIYEKIKKDMSDVRVNFVLATQDETSPYWLPKDITKHILTCAHVPSKNQARIQQAKYEVRLPRTTFIMGASDPKSALYGIPKEIIQEIVLADRDNFPGRVNEASL